MFFAPLSREGNFGLPVQYCAYRIVQLPYGIVPAPAFEVLRHSGANSPIDAGCVGVRLGRILLQS